MFGMMFFAKSVVPTVTNYIHYDDVAAQVNGWNNRFYDAEDPFAVVGNKFYVHTTKGYGGIFNMELTVSEVKTLELSFKCDDIGGTGAIPYIVVKSSDGIDILSQDVALGSNKIIFNKPQSDILVMVYLLLKNAAKAYYYDLSIVDVVV